MFNRKEIFIFSICWTHLIFFACIIPGTELPEINLSFNLQLDKFVHATFFIVFFILWSHVRINYTKWHGVVLIFLSLLYGTIIEFYQFNFVDGRGFEFADIVADASGGIIGFIIQQLHPNFLYKK